MRDLLVIVPSRGRPARLAAMIEARLSLAEAETFVAVAVDADDPELTRYRALWSGAARWSLTEGPRRTLSGWTNYLAAASAGRYRALASLGDDHLPRTPGWDRLLLEALDKLGGEGIAYGNDLHQREALPTAPVISAGIVEALGWMCLPAVSHYFVDDAWAALGRGAGCLAYVPEAVIEHCHPDAGKSAGDATYAEAEAGAAADREAYRKWLRDGMDRDVARVRSVLRR